MIQRIQTVYLLISALMTGNLLVIPMAKAASNNGIFSLGINGITDITAAENGERLFSTWPITALIVLSTLFSLITIFFYKKRILQIRMCSINAVLMAGLTGMILYTAHSLGKHVEGVVSYSFAAFMPLIGVILTILAIRAIGKDEALIRSVNRLR